MIRISKITDYGIVLLTYFAHGADPPVYSARELAEESKLPLPIVSKILKQLSQHNLLESHRGKNGGYRLSRSPRDINVAEIIGALEGPIAMTECMEKESMCKYEINCPVRHNWQTINLAVKAALESVPLTAMHGPVANRFAAVAGKA